MDDRAFTILIEFLEKVPAIDGAIGKGQVTIFPEEKDLVEALVEVVPEVGLEPTRP